jgi:hypothetical protein
MSDVAQRVRHNAAQAKYYKEHKGDPNFQKQRRAVEHKRQRTMRISRSMEKDDHDHLRAAVARAAKRDPPREYCSESESDGEDSEDEIAAYKKLDELDAADDPADPDFAPWSHKTLYKKYKSWRSSSHGLFKKMTGVPHAAFLQLWQLAEPAYKMTTMKGGDRELPGADQYRIPDYLQFLVLLFWLRTVRARYSAHTACRSHSRNLISTLMRVPVRDVPAHGGPFWCAEDVLVQSDPPRHRRARQGRPGGVARPRWCRCAHLRGAGEAAQKVRWAGRVRTRP